MDIRNITLGKLMLARSVIIECADIDINPKASYNLMKIMDMTEKDEQFYNDKMKTIIQKYGTKDDDGKLIFDENGGIRVGADKIQEAQDKIGELEEIEVEVPSKYLISLDDLSEMKLSYRKIRALMPFLIEE